MQAEPASNGNRCGIRDTQLHARLPLIVIEPQRSRDVQPGVVAGGEKRLSQRRLRGAEGDSLEPGAIVGRQLEAHMAAGADDLREFYPVPGKREDRLWIARAEGPGPLDVLDELHGGAAGAEGGIDPEGGERTGGTDRPPERLAHMGAERPELAGFQRDARRHRVTAALLDDVGF